MSDVWVGVIGGAVGGFFTALVSLSSPWISWFVKSRELDKTRDVERQRERQGHRRELITQWRESIFQTHHELVMHEVQRRREAGAQDPVIEQLEGRAWFESLRPHLSLSEDEVGQISINFDMSSMVRKLSDEVARIEREWELV
ncbi:hypothetical protein JWS13_10010 [Rhodococcus pseudokoreensis]|uniref:Minor tail protein n=1 Tax=Rhodococcus pseudokoreensis TaxID=2811421 RepID=A0A974ZSK4_9NOCA|nr:hypothetical protein [Rhodococcus pseudokoreensis]QSE88916.1 hypothetical protein JWS13_10010 [Rhodococcus pseudokoreensis]